MQNITSFITMKSKDKTVWLNAANKGSKVPGTPCVPMKTPLAGKAWSLNELVRTSPQVNHIPQLCSANCI